MSLVQEPTMVTDAGASPSMDSEEVRSLPMAPMPLVLKYDHLKTTTGWVTEIVRTFADPDRCGLCPKCDHRGGFCLVRAPEYVPPALCARYRLRG